MQQKRNVCIVGPADCGKSFLLKGMLEFFDTYSRPDGGSYQLEDLLGKELVLLNDFEYDAQAKEWMPWQYFKNFLEGASVLVGCPKNKGGNQIFEGAAPVFLTAPQEVTLMRYGKEVTYETEQMRKRVTYLILKKSIPEEQRQEVLRVCPHCSARVYLEGKALLDISVAPAILLGPTVSDALPPAKRQRTVTQCIHELKELKTLLDAGAVSQSEFEKLKSELLAGR